LLRVLQRLGLMPAGDVSTPEGVDALIKSLDAELRSTWESQADHRMRQLLPYRLRAAAIAGRLEPFEVGRALYHLAQRRGFLSNRRDAVGDEEEAGKVRAGIIELQKLMEAAGGGGGHRTLGEYFASLDPTDPDQRRIRGRWTARDMYAEEFDRIWTEQARHHAAMTPEARREVHNAIFFQRPLKSAAHLVGQCELVPGKRRAKMGLRVAQRFRMLQRLNDLRILLPDHTQRGLTGEERAKVLAGLERHGDLTFTALRGKSYLGLPRGATFNLEEGGEKKLVGHRTDARLRKIFGDRFDALSESDRDAIVDDLLSFEKPAALARRGANRWGLSDEAAADFGELLLEQGHAAHCAEALARLTARMEDGTPYTTAKRELYPASVRATEAADVLPPVLEAMGDIRNPAVTRALTELRKVVNAIVRRYGKPECVRIELSRDLKRSRTQRERMSRENREQERRRDDAARRIAREAGVQQPRRSDIERVLLAEECGWVCPYTGRAFGMEDLIGRHPKLDVEHIWPLPRSLDDSFFNKTLCWHEENRARKRNRTPFEAYGADARRWEEIIDRVKRFTSDAARIKLERFRAEAIPEGFTERHLAETRYTSALAAEYLGLLYGATSGGDDATGRKRIFITSGGLTSHLRREWGLNGVLSLSDEKNRADHRHHAIDAVVIALTDTRAVQTLQRAAEEASATGRRLFAPAAPPWSGFVDDVRRSVEAINVSHRQSRRVSGKLHGETLYSRAMTGNDGTRRHRVRKELHKLTAPEVERIADARVREAVKAKLRELGLAPAKAFIDPSNHPHLVTGDGQRVPIHKVRIEVTDIPWRVGAGARERLVCSTAGSNHHTVVRKAVGRGNKEVWSDAPTTLIEAYRRRGAGEPIVAGTGDEGFVFSLAANEFVIMKDDEGRERLYRVLGISEGDIELVEHIDGRNATERKAAKARVRTRGSDLQARQARKVAVTYLGEVRDAGG
jgi:CRISPR-associated endonuclease Csn1